MSEILDQMSGSTDDPSGTQAVTTGAEPERVGPYLARVLDDPAWSAPSVRLIAGGKSNLTYLVSSAAGRVVLRRPPLAAVLPTAHDMTREFRVLSALQDTPVPVPTVRHLCEDESVLGVRFYLMDYVDGLVVRDQLPAGYADRDEQRQAIGHALIDVLVQIHGVPPTGALEGYGPPEGYLARQIRRWTRQWEASRDAIGRELPELDALAADLGAGAPEQRETTLVHGDYRLDNTMLDHHDPGRIRAVLDWELSTLGDPLADLGLLCVYWHGRAEGPIASSPEATWLVRTVTTEAGFPTRAELVRRYAERSGRDISALPWYVAFGYFKLAVIAAGIAARAKAGGMLGEGFDTVAATVPPLVQSGRYVLDNGRLD